MYNWYAWVELMDGDVAADDKAAFQRKLDDLRRGAAGLDLRVSPADPVTCINGVNLFLAAGSRNHRGNSDTLLVDFLRGLARALPWSRGVVYVYDDEDPHQPEGLAYRVLVVMKGQVLERWDPFLSPLIPNTEEPVTFPDSGPEGADAE